MDEFVEKRHKTSFYRGLANNYFAVNILHHSAIGFIARFLNPDLADKQNS